MVKASEVRIGNWVEHSGGRKPKMITCEDFWSHYDFQDGKDRFYYYDPIPLTPEILEQCGFEQSNEFDDTFRLNDFDIYYRKGYCEWVVDDRGDTEGTKPRLIKYLHQLQNLYFALTNEELIFQSIKELK